MIDALTLAVMSLLSLHNDGWLQGRSPHNQGFVVTFDLAARTLLIGALSDWEKSA